MLEDAHADEEQGAWRRKRYRRGEFHVNIELTFTSPFHEPIVGKGVGEGVGDEESC